MTTFPRAEPVTEDPLLEEARAMRQRRRPIPLDIAFTLVDMAMWQEGPDFVYNRLSCVNWEEDPNTESVVGSCLIGRVFELVVSDFGSKGDKSDPVAVLNDAYVTDPVTREGAVFDRNAVAFLRRVQRRQDERSAWGEAVDRSKAEFLDLLLDRSTE
jgi:hypothetical protein